MANEIEQVLYQMTKPAIALILRVEADRKKAGEEFIAMPKAEREGVRSLAKAINRLLSYEEINGEKEAE